MEKIRKAECYEQIKKNTVNAANQLRETEYVTFENTDGAGIRVMFVGNSITLHGVAHHIGWHNNWGMAASAKEKDYVHRMISKINAVKEDASYCICQVSAWERGYMEGTEKFYALYESARNFHADLIVLRFVENCSFDGFDEELFKTELGKLLNFFDPERRAQTIITTGFWRHCADDTIREFAKENQISVVELGDLGEKDEMKALGLFEHSGVANHPGDSGMEKIAERIFEKINI